MPLFVCAKCECVENTALGMYWTRVVMKNDYKWTPENEKFKGKGLCSACMPTHYTDGTLTGGGQWHGKFEREHYKKSNYEGLLQLPT